MENIALEEMAWSVGWFGDRRRDKGGLRCWNVWLRMPRYALPAGRWVPRATRPLWPVSRQSERDGCGAAGRLGRTGRSCGDRPACSGDPGYQRGSFPHDRGAPAWPGRGWPRQHPWLAGACHAGAGCGHRQLPGAGRRAGVDALRHVRVTPNRRALADKASERRLTTAGRAKEVLAAATMVTVIADRASDLYAALRQAQEGDGARAQLSYSDARHAGPSPGQGRRAVRDGGRFSSGRHAHDRAAPARAARAGSRRV